MRLVTIHHGSELNEKLQIAADGVGPGGASHKYEVSGEDALMTLIQFQEGALKEVGFNGISDEALIAIVTDRLRGFQRGKFSCRENALALTKLEEAMHWLNARTKDRMNRGVEGRSIA